MAEFKDGDYVEITLRGKLRNTGVRYADVTLDTGLNVLGIPLEVASRISKLLEVGDEVVICDRDHKLPCGSVVGTLVKLSDGRWHETRYNDSFDPSGLSSPLEVKYLP